MPAMLRPAEFDNWLSGSLPKDVLEQPPLALQEWIVDKRVNKTSAGDDDPATIEPVLV